MGVERPDAGQLVLAQIQVDRVRTLVGLLVIQRPGRPAALLAQAGDFLTEPLVKLLKPLDVIAQQRKNRAGQQGRGQPFDLVDVIVGRSAHASRAAAAHSDG